MPRYKLIIEYDGMGLCGWQRQNDVPTGQGFLEKAVYRFCGETVTSHCAGRTDAGVHARGQVAHIDIHKEISADRMREALNFYLRDTQLSVLEAEIVSTDFHARFSAIGRRYVYRIINRRPPVVIERNYVWHVPYALDVDAMQDAAKELIGTHDFSSFRDSQCQSKNPLKTLEELRLEKRGEEILVHAASRSFLHHQVRIMVGSLVMVGKGAWNRKKLAEARDARTRSAGGPTAPPQGLYLTKVLYPEPQKE